MRAVPVALALAMMACSLTDPTNGTDDAYELVSFQELGLAVGSAIYACNRWLHVPSGDPLVLDFFFELGGLDDENLSPDVEDLSMLREAGATILHEFNVSGARAEVPRAYLHLVTGPTVNHVRFVPREDRFDLEVSVGYLPEAEEQIQERALELGAHIEYTLPHHAGGVPSFFGVVPDAAIAQLRQEFPETLAFAQHQQKMCLAGL
jgi:hypothetical protein